MKVSCKAQSLASLEKKWTLIGNFLKIQDFACKTHFVEESFVIMIPTSCYVHFY